MKWTFHRKRKLSTCNIFSQSTFFNIKCIDWSSKVCKIRHIQPSWRKNEDQIPPVNAFNLYSKDIEKRIHSNKENFSGAAVSQQYSDFLKKGVVVATRMKQKMKPSTSPQQANAISSNNGPGRRIRSAKRQYSQKSSQ